LGEGGAGEKRQQGDDARRHEPYFSNTKNASPNGNASVGRYRAH
jgi:hypothetical protein